MDKEIAEKVNGRMGGYMSDGQVICKTISNDEYFLFGKHFPAVQVFKSSLF